MSLVSGYSTVLPQTDIYSTQVTPSQIPEMLTSEQSPFLWTPKLSNNKVSNNNVSFEDWVTSQGISEEKMNEVIHNTIGKDISRFSSRSSKFKKEYPYMEDLVFSYYATSFSNLIKPIKDPYGNVVTPLQQAIYREDYNMIYFLLDNKVPSGKQPDGLTIIETVLHSQLKLTNKQALIENFIDKYDIKLTKPDSLIKTILRSPLTITNKQALIIYFIHNNKIKLNKSEEPLYDKLLLNVLKYTKARNASWFWAVNPPTTKYKGGKHRKTHHRRRTMRKKHTKTRRHHRK
jgi:hypothetical protein